MMASCDASVVPEVAAVSSTMCVHLEVAETVTSFLLPAELLCKVLCYVDPKQRNGACALVCRAWKAAARAASTSITFDLRKSTFPRSFPRGRAKSASLTQWLMSDANRVISIEARGAFTASAQPLELQLPFHNLKKLECLQIEWFTVETFRAAPSHIPTGAAEINNISNVGNHLGDLVSLTCLDLSLSSITVEDGLQSLSALTKPRRLRLWNVQPVDQACAALNAALACLSQLTHITVETCDNHAGSGLEGLTVQSNLQELELSHCRLSLGGLWTLPASLSRLHFISVEVPQPQGEDALLKESTTEFARIPWSWRLCYLPNLHHLVLQNMLVDGLACHDVVSRLSNLRYLSLEGSSCEQEGINTPDLLAGLQYMTNLQHLNLRGTLCSMVQPVAAYSVLTTSSKLTCLDLRGCKLPPGVIGVMFPLLQRLPDLHALIIRKLDCHDMDWDETHGDDMTAFGLESLVTCCPNLHELHICGTLQKGEQLTTLGTLQQLRTLTIGGATLDDDVATAAVPHLSRVVHLSIARSPSFTAHGLVSLTQLTQLTVLEVAKCGVCKGLSQKIRKIQSKDNPPDVCKRLEQECLMHVVSRDLILARRRQDATL